jgi:hypothetical protein
MHWPCASRMRYAFRSSSHICNSHSEPEMAVFFISSHPTPCGAPGHVFTPRISEVEPPPRKFIQNSKKEKPRPLRSHECVAWNRVSC